MAAPCGVLPEIEQILNRVALETTRATRAAAIAEEHEEFVHHAIPAVRAHHQRMAALHRRVEHRHRAAACVHRAYADRLRSWAATAAAGAHRPSFLAAVASAVGASSATVTLLTSDKTEASRSADNIIARTASDLEYKLREGPGRDAAALGELVTATGDELTSRWPSYGRAISALGINTVAAAPLRHGEHSFGALTTFNPPPDQHEAVSELADALTHTFLLTDGELDHLDQHGNGLGLLTEADVQPVINQAAGIVATQQDCEVKDALALIRSRAYATHSPTDHIADQIVRENLQLD